MDRLIQIIYVSRSSFLPAMSATGIEPTVARILAKSRSNNRKNGLVGVLYFGDGCFFQCLEGKETEIDKLYAKLQLDTRHKDLKLISRKPISDLSFSDWAMKYVPLEDRLNAELQTHGYSKFDPYIFDAQMTSKVLNLLHSSTNEDEENLLATSSSNQPIVEKPTNNLAILAIALSVISLAVSIFNFVSFK